MVSTLGISFFSVKKSFLELVDLLQAAGLVSLSASHTAIVLVSSLCYPPGDPFYFCLVAQEKADYTVVMCLI